MSPRVPIFISAVTSELKSARQLVANSLQFLGYAPVWQDIFGSEQGDLRGVLRKKVDECKGVIQLVGQNYGAEPPVPDERWGRVSYTQYEALYARERGKKVWYMLLQDTFTSDPHTPETGELRQLQADYRRRVQADMHIYHPLASPDALEANVLKLRDDLASLRQSVKQWATAVILLLLLLCATAFWIMRYQHVQTVSVQTQGHQVATAVEHNATELKGVTTELSRIRLADGGKGFGNLPPNRQEELNRQVKVIGIDKLLERTRQIEFPAQLNVTLQQLETIADNFAKQQFTDWPTLRAAAEKSCEQFVSCVKDRAREEHAAHDQIQAALRDLRSSQESIEKVEDMFPKNYEEKVVLKAVLDDLTPRISREEDRLKSIDGSVVAAYGGTMQKMFPIFEAVSEKGSSMATRVSERGNEKLTSMSRTSMEMNRALMERARAGKLPDNPPRPDPGAMKKIQEDQQAWQDSQKAFHDIMSETMPLIERLRAQVESAGELKPSGL